MNKSIALILAFILTIAVALSWGLHASAQERKIEALEQQLIAAQDENGRLEIQLAVSKAREPERLVKTLKETANWLDHADMALDELERILKDNVEANIVIKDIRAVIDSANAELGQALSEDIVQLIVQEAEARGVDPMILTAMAYRESGFNPEARGKAGEYGLIQIMPSTGAWIADRLGYTDWKPADMLDIETNIKFAAYYLWAVTQDMGDTWAGVLAYNAGPTGARNWLAGNDVETHDYVRKVQATYNSFRGC